MAKKIRNFSIIIFFISIFLLIANYLYRTYAEINISPKYDIFDNDTSVSPSHCPVNETRLGVDKI